METLFYAVSQALLQKNDSTLLQRLGCSTQTVKKLARVLRQATVTEWLREFTLSILTHDQLREQAQIFLQDGEYCGDIGDLVLPALVNTLSLPIAVFTSADNMPVVTLLPISSIPTDSHPLFIAYRVDAVGDKENTQAELQVEKCTWKKLIQGCVMCLYFVPL